jgi:hypothetical protein
VFDQLVFIQPFGLLSPDKPWFGMAIPAVFLNLGIL